MRHDGRRRRGAVGEAPGTLRGGELATCEQPLYEEDAIALELLPLLVRELSDLGTPPRVNQHSSAI